MPVCFKLVPRHFQQYNSIIRKKSRWICCGSQQSPHRAKSSPGPQRNWFKSRLDRKPGKKSYLCNTLPSLQMVAVKLMVAKGLCGLRQVLPADSNPIWEAQYPLPRGGQAWDLGPAWMRFSVTQPHSLVFHLPGPADIRTFRDQWFQPGRDLRWTGEAEARGVALLGGGEGMGRNKVRQPHTQKV